MRGERLFVASVLVVLGGCATLIHGPYEDVAFESNPPGATATVTATMSERGPNYLDPKKSYTVTTPATLRLRRDNTYRVEMQKPGYRIATSKVVSSYDWAWAPVTCGPCELVGDLPTYDMKGPPASRPLRAGRVLRVSRGFVRAWGRGLRIFSPRGAPRELVQAARRERRLLRQLARVGTPRIAADARANGLTPLRARFCTRAASTRLVFSARPGNRDFSLAPMLLRA
jgi:hypothetical protein